MAKLLFKTTDRDQAHRQLALVLTGSDYPRACCKEMVNDPKPYQVWSDDVGDIEPPLDPQLPDPP